MTPTSAGVVRLPVDANAALFRCCCYCIAHCLGHTCVVAYFCVVVVGNIGAIGSVFGGVVVVIVAIVPLLNLERAIKKLQLGIVG